MRKRIVYLLLSIGLFSSCAQQDISFTRKMEPVNFSQVTITDRFWKPRLETHAATTLGVCIEQCELATNRVRNFAIAAKVIPGEFEGLVYDDSDLYKMIEGVSYSLSNHSIPALEAKIDCRLYLKSTNGRWLSDDLLYIGRHESALDRYG